MRATIGSVCAAWLGASLVTGVAWAQPAGPPLPPSAPSLPPGASAARGASAPATPPVTGFSFGSYGRVTVASDLRGRTGRQANVVAFGPRLDAPSYAELQFNYSGQHRHVAWRTVITLAANENLFHFTGRFDQTFAVRNLYLEARGMMSPRLSLWAGSRMYRGDDVYLLNWWPLDNLNMVGGGARYELGDNVLLAAAVGINRLEDPYQLQVLRVTPRDGFGPATAYLLDRPRILSSLKATWFSNGRNASSGLKIALYAEHHAMSAGVRQLNDAGARVELPADAGYVVGAQLGIYRGANFVNLFTRFGQGLGAYGDLRVPVTLASGRTAERAQEFNVAMAGNYEHGPFAVMLGAYFRYFRDADPGVFGRAALQEGAVNVRPMLWFGHHVGVAVDASVQHVSYLALDPATGQGAVTGTVGRFGVIPFVSPGGRGSYTRPHLQLMYVATARDAGARRLYATDDPFGFYSVEHFLGVSTEWWFNSSYL